MGSWGYEYYSNDDYFDELNELNDLITNLFDKLQTTIDEIKKDESTRQVVDFLDKNNIPRNDKNFLIHKENEPNFLRARLMLTFSIIENIKSFRLNKQQKHIIVEAVSILKKLTDDNKYDWGKPEELVTKVNEDIQQISVWLEKLDKN
jgi:hypothetical protein